MNEKQIKRTYRAACGEDLSEKIESFRKKKNLSWNDFGRLMVSMFPEYRNYTAVVKRLREMSNGRAFSDKLAANARNCITQFRLQRDITRILGKKRTGYKPSPPGCSLETQETRLSQLNFGGRYVIRFMREAGA